MSLNFRVTFYDDGRCRIFYSDYDGYILSETKQLEPDSDEECLAYAYDIIGFVASENNRFGQSCSIEQTQTVIASVKSLIQPFLMTEIVIVVAVVVMRILKQLRPI